jgi:Ger(x)C family germination protein
VEIEQRAFVAIVAIDKAPPGYAEQAAESVKGVPGTEKQTGNMMKVTYLFPQATQLAGEGGGGGGGGGGGDKGFTDIASVATSIDKTSRYVDARISRRLFFGFTQAIIFGEEFLKDPDSVKSVLDSITRDPEYNRSARVLVAEGDASRIAELQPKGEKLMFRYIRGILDNEASNGRILQVDFNEFLAHGEEIGTGVIPKIVIKDKEAKISGFGLVKDYKLLGFLPEYDSMFFNLLNGTRKGGTESIKVGEAQADFALREMKRQITLLNDDPKNLEIGIKMEIEGTLLGGKAGVNMYDDETIAYIEKELNSMEEESCRFVIQKLQKEFNMDALDLGRYLSKFHPLVWDEVKDKWDEIYPNIKITPTVKNEVRRIGTSK